MAPLDPRLAAAADFVRGGSRAADIGTDHGYLAAFLLRSGRCPYVIAADIADGPLAAARKTLGDLPSERCRILRSDGLSALPACGADDIVIAGMGGELIARILARAPHFHRPEKRFILQPMTRAHLLRAYLGQSGFSVLAEKPVLSSGRAYTVMCCAYTGTAAVPDEVGCYLGKIPLPPDEAGLRLLGALRATLCKQRRAAKAPEAAQRLDRLLAAIETAIQGGDPFGT